MVKIPNHQQADIVALYRLFSLTYPIRNIMWLFMRIVILLSRRRIIIVNGFSRSGTTMLGEFLGFAPGSVYIHECVKQVLQHQSEVKNIHKEDFWNHYLGDTDSSEKVHALVCSILYFLIKAPGGISMLVIKPGLFQTAMPAFERKFGFLLQVYISRHPCGNIDSLIRQQKLHRSDEIIFSKDRITTMAAKWARHILQALECSGKRPHWIWIRFETLSGNPIPEFRKLYSLLELDFTGEVMEKIINFTTSGDGKFYEPRRNAATQAEKWKVNLDASQIETIRLETIKVNTGLYDGF